MNRTRILTNRDGKIYHNLFHENMVLLMEYNAVTSELKKCFKMDMFAVPNMVGFMHVTHFLLKIIYPNTNEFRDCWPVFEKSQERDFRNKATQMLRGIRSDFPNFQFPEIIASKFLSPGGFWFIIIAWNLTVLALTVQAKRDLGCSLLNKSSGKLKEKNKPLAVKLLNLSTVENLERVEKVKLSMKKFMEEFDSTKQYLMDQKQKSKLNLSKFLSALDENELWNSLEENQRNEVINSKSEDILTSFLGKFADSNKRTVKYCELINVEALNNQAEIVNEIMHREELEHKYIISSKTLAVGDGSEISLSKYVGNDAVVSDTLIPEDGKPIRLLDYFSKPLEELKSVKIDWGKDYPSQLNNWEKIWEEWEENRNEMSRLELQLNSKLEEIITKYNRERDSRGEVPESPKSMLSDCQNVCTSTPIRDNSCGKLLDITPYKKPSSGDYFDETYKELLAEASRKTQSVITECSPKPNFSSSTVEELRERLKRIQLGMKKD